tara:strand:+ start:15794 stop:15943 length:150 start_codon:yes stop_codon:yes gene_type:complete
MVSEKTCLSPVMTATGFSVIWLLDDLDWDIPAVPNPMFPVSTHGTDLRL